MGIRKSKEGEREAYEQTNDKRVSAWEWKYKDTHESLVRAHTWKYDYKCTFK